MPGSGRSTGPAVSISFPETDHIVGVNLAMPIGPRHQAFICMSTFRAAWKNVEVRIGDVFDLASHRHNDDMRSRDG